MAVSARGETVEHKEHELRGAFDHKEASRTTQACLGWGSEALWRANPLSGASETGPCWGAEELSEGKYSRLRSERRELKEVEGTSGLSGVRRIVFLSFCWFTARVTAWGKEIPEWGGCCAGGATWMPTWKFNVNPRTEATVASGVVL